VLAINPASVKSHQNYSEKMGFNFPILSDPDRKALTEYKAAKADGKGVLRTVYALDPKGRVIFAERGHADLNKVLDTIKSHS
jgi:peroxiredoxin Q/BCP